MKIQRGAEQRSAEEEKTEIHCNFIKEKKKEKTHLKIHSAHRGSSRRQMLVFSGILVNLKKVNNYKRATEGS